MPRFGNSGALEIPKCVEDRIHKKQSTARASPNLVENKKFSKCLCQSGILEPCGHDTEPWKTVLPAWLFGWRGQGFDGLRRIVG